MTNYEFACINLEANILKPIRKKFKELSYGDNVYCILLWKEPGHNQTSTIYKYTFKNAMMEGNSEENHKLRKALFYLTDKQPYIGFKADIHKSGSIIAAINTKKQTYIRIYATTKEECIERATKILGNDSFKEHLITSIIT